MDEDVFYYHKRMGPWLAAMLEYTLAGIESLPSEDYLVQ